MESGRNYERETHHIERELRYAEFVAKHGFVLVPVEADACVLVLWGS